MEDLYSLVQRRIWTDARFRKLSKPEPNARDLFLYLLTTPRATPVPGLLVTGEPALAEELDWSLKGLQRCMVELESAGMVRIDRAARLLWLPNGLRHNPPRSPKNVLGWAKHWRMLPECALLTEATASFSTSMKERGSSFSEAFCRATGSVPSLPSSEDDGNGDAARTPSEMGSMIGSGMPSHMAYQEQEQEQEQDQDTKTLTRGRARDEAQDEGPSSEPLSRAAMVTTEQVADALRTIPALQALADDAGRLGLIVGGYHIAQGNLATLEGARQAIGAFVAKELPNMPDATTAQIGSALAGYLANQRRDRSAPRAGEPRGSEPVHPDIVATLDAFGAAWTAKKGRAFVQADGDERHAAKLLAAAREQARRIGGGAGAIVRHWAEQYVRDTERFVADQEHPLRLLPSRLTSYGLPPAPAQKKPKPVTSEACVPPPADLLSSIRRGAHE